MQGRPLYIQQNVKVTSIVVMAVNLLTQGGGPLWHKLSLFDGNVGKTFCELSQIIFKFCELLGSSSFVSWLIGF